jgi:glycosidase
MPPPPLNAHAPWIDNAVVYEIFPRTFSPEGKLNKVTARLDELKALGINCIWFMPIHPSPTTHGYAITDYFDINPEYGTLADFRALVQEAHKRGIRVIIDVVIQHSSFLHPFMQDAYTYGPASPFYDFYIWNAPQNYHYEFTWVDLPSINYDSAATRDYLLRMIRYWFEEYDIDGVRCDVAHVIESLRPPGPAFWQEMRRMIRDLKADALLLAEADALSLQSIFDLKFDAAYDWNIFTKIKNFIGGQLTIANFNAELNNYTPQRGFPSHALPFRFLENHDEERFIKSHNVAETKQAGALLMTLPGLPMLYAGQEVGELEFRSIINWSDPNQLRPYYQKLVQLRRQHPALQQGQLTLLNATPSEQIYAYLRASGKDVMLAAHNLSTGNVKAKIALKGLNLPFKAYWFDELTRQGYVHGDTLVVNLASRASAILVPSHSITAVEGPAMALPRTFALQQNFPNPFNPETRLRYSVPENGRRFSLRIFNVLGQQVKTLFDGTQAAGEHEVIWDGRNSKGELAGTGLYFVVMQAENFRAVRKMMVVR